MAGLSKAWVCGRSVVGIGVSNLTEGMNFSPVNVVCCQVEFSATAHSSGEILQCVLCLSVISKLREKRGHDQNEDRSATVRK